jgi:hypothetical protein
MMRVALQPRQDSIGGIQRSGDTSIVEGCLAVTDGMFVHVQLLE